MFVALSKTSWQYFLRRGKPLMIIWLWVMITDRFNWSSFLTHCGPLDCHYSGFLLVLHFPCSHYQWHCGSLTYTSSHWETWQSQPASRSDRVRTTQTGIDSKEDWNIHITILHIAQDLYLDTLLLLYLCIVRIEVWKTNPNHRLLVFPSIYIHFIWYFYRFHICNIFKTFSSSRFLHFAFTFTNRILKTFNLEKKLTSLNTEKLCKTIYNIILPYLLKFCN